MPLGDEIFKKLPYRMQSDIAYGNYMNAEADINRLQGLNQNLASYREALQEAQQAKFTAGEEYLAAINASRKQQGKEPFTGWPEEAMGTRRVMPAVDRMGAPLTPDEEDQYRHTPPRRAYPVSAEELGQVKDLVALQNADQPSDPSYQIGTIGNSLRTSPSREEFLGPKAAQPESPATQPESQPEKKQPDFVKASNVKQQRPPTPMEEYDRLLNNGDIGDAMDLRYSIEKQIYDRNVQKINNAAQQIAQVAGTAEARAFFDFQMGIAENKRKNLRSVEDTEAFKTAQTFVNRAGYLQTRDTVSQLGEQLAQAKKMISDGKSETEVIRLLSVSVPKILQSLGTGQSDAIQKEEAQRLMPEFQTLLGQGLNVNNMFDLISKKDFTELFAKQPAKFIEKAEKIYNSAAKIQNQNASRFQKQIGQRAAKSLLLEKLPEEVEAGNTSPFVNIMEKAAKMRGFSRQEFQQSLQQTPVQTTYGTLKGGTNPASIYPKLGY